MVVITQLAKSKMKFKTTTKIITGAIIALIIFFSLLVAVPFFHIPGGYRLYTVQSGSMEPTIKTGSLIISRTSNDYQVGDIITYKSLKELNNPNPRETTTHRVEEIKQKNDTTSFITKGDANTVVDIKSVLPMQVLGKTMFYFPYIGYPISFARTQTGLIVMIIIPAIIIVYSEILNIKKEILLLIKKRKNEKKNS